jgi:hypothetical protein
MYSYLCCMYMHPCQCICLYVYMCVCMRVHMHHNSSFVECLCHLLRQKRLGYVTVVERILNILGLIYKMLTTCIILSYNFHGNICESILNLMDALHIF